MKDILTHVHIADIHFAAFNPKLQYQILSEQCFNIIDQIPSVDIISIDGDFFDHKIMSNSDGSMYACMAMENIVQIARRKNATIVLIHGTYSHDADQLKLFYHYLDDPTIDIRIVSTIQFEEIKGVRVLCIPELYGLDESVYQKFLHQSGYYNMAFMHGTFEGAVYGNNVGLGRLFRMEDFDKCMGPIISGHVHTGGCFQTYFYYCGSPYRWKFGEEEDKGFLIVSQNLVTGEHYTHFQKIESFRYDTIYLDELVSNDPKQIIDYINELKVNRGIDFIKIRFRVPMEGAMKTIINNFYRNSRDTFVEFLDKEEQQKLEAEKRAQSESAYAYLFDQNTSPIEKLVRYINDKEQDQVISIDQLKEMLGDSL